MRIGPDAAVLVGAHTTTQVRPPPWACAFCSLGGYAQGAPDDLGAQAVLSDLSALRGWL